MQTISVDVIKRAFGLKPKKVIPVSELTIEDVLSGKYFSVFRPSDSMAKIINGLTVVNDDVVYRYAKISGIAIICDDEFPPCGKGFLVNVVAYYGIHQKHADGTEEPLNTGLSSVVNAIIKTSSPSFVYDKPYINGPENNTSYDIVFNVNASYHFDGKKYTASKKLTQGTNRLSSYIPYKENTHYITATLSNPVVSNKGGVSFLKIERMYDKLLHRVDMCGNPKDEKVESSLIEDITTKALVVTEGKNWLSVKNGIVTVKPQEFGAKERTSNIMVSYLGNRATCTLTQNEGGKMNYKYELYFEGGFSTKFVDLETSLKGRFYVPVISKVNRHVDDEYKDTLDALNLNVYSDSSWVNGRVIKVNDKVNIELTVNEDNPSIENDREATITVVNADDASKSVTIIASQPAMAVVTDDYVFTFVKDGTYTSEELNNTKLYFAPKKRYIYENGNIVYNNVEDYVNVGYDFNCNSKGLFNIYNIIREGDKYYLLFTNNTFKSSVEIKCNIYGTINDIAGKEIFRTEPFTIIIKGNDIITYQHELCFDGHSKHYEVTWNADKSVKKIPIKSVKHKVVNSVEKEEMPSPYIVVCTNNMDKTYFSIKALNDGILCFPYKNDMPVECNYDIIQKDTQDVITLKLIYKKKATIRNVRVVVKMIRKGIRNDVWTGNDGHLVIDNEKTIKLKPCWLYPNATDEYDIAYNGIIALKEGTHHFETFNVYSIDGIGKTMTECNVNKEVIIDDKTEKIDIIIEL